MSTLDIVLDIPDRMSEAAPTPIQPAYRLCCTTFHGRGKSLCARLSHCVESDGWQDPSSSTILDFLGDDAG